MSRTTASALVLASMMMVPYKTQLAQACGFEAVTPTGTGFTVNTSGPPNELVTINTTSPVTIVWTPSTTAEAGGPTAPINFLPSANSVMFRNDASIDGQNFTVINKIMPTAGNEGRTVSLNGEILGRVFTGQTSAPGGNIWFYSPGGLLIGPQAKIDVGTLVLGAGGAGGITAESGTQFHVAGTGSSTAVVEIQQEAGSTNSIKTTGFLAVVAPRIVQARSNVVAGGSVAYIAAADATVSMSNGLFDISAPVGSAASGNSASTAAIVHSGTTTSTVGVDGGKNFVYLVAIPQNQMMTMLLTGGQVVVNEATDVTANDKGIFLSAGSTTNTEYDIQSENPRETDVAFGGLAGGANGGATVNIVGGSFTAERAGIGSSVANLTLSGVNFGAIERDTRVFAPGKNVTIDTAAGNSSFKGLRVFTAQDVDFDDGLTSFTGGNVTFDVVGDGAGVSRTLTIDGSVFVDAYGFSGGVGNAQGGTVKLGTRLINGATGATMTVTGSTMIDASGNAGTEGGVGGTGTGGTVTVVAKGNGTSGNMTFSNGFTAFVNGQGGRNNDDGGSNLNGGAGTGGIFRAIADGRTTGSQPSYTTISFNQLGVDASGIGGSSLLGNGGAGQGGTLTLGIHPDLPTGATGRITAVQNVMLDGSAHGGNADHGNGGNATGGVAVAVTDGGSNIQMGGFGLFTNAIGGDSGGEDDGKHGGSAFGGRAGLSVVAGGVMQAGGNGTDNIVADAIGGSGHDGGNATAGSGLLENRATGKGSFISAQAGTLTLGGGTIKLLADARAGEANITDSNGSVGQGGNALGGDAFVTAFSDTSGMGQIGAIKGSGSAIQASVNADGGNASGSAGEGSAGSDITGLGVAGGRGGDGFAGRISILAEAGSGQLELGNVNAYASSYGGSGGRGGDAEDSNLAGGAGGIGGNAKGGGIQLGMVSDQSGPQTGTDLGHAFFSSVSMNFGAVAGDGGTGGTGDGTAAGGIGGRGGNATGGGYDAAHVVAVVGRGSSPDMQNPMVRVGVAIGPSSSSSARLTMGGSVNGGRGGDGGESTGSGSMGNGGQGGDATGSSFAILSTKRASPRETRGLVKIAGADLSANAYAGEGGYGPSDTRGADGFEQLGKFDLIADNGDLEFHGSTLITMGGGTDTPLNAPASVIQAGFGAIVFDGVAGGNGSDTPVDLRIDGQGDPANINLAFYLDTQGQLVRTHNTSTVNVRTGSVTNLCALTAPVSCNPAPNPPGGLTPGPVPPSFTTPGTLGGATQNSAYSTTLGVTGGTGPYSYTLQSGSLPAGVTLTQSGPNAGRISGTPTGTGTSTFTIVVTDSSVPPRTSMPMTFSLTVSAPPVVTPPQPDPDPEPEPPVVTPPTNPEPPVVTPPTDPNPPTNPNPPTDPNPPTNPNPPTDPNPPTNPNPPTPVPPAQDPVVQESLQQETSQISASLQASLTGTRVAGGNVGSTSDAGTGDATSAATSAGSSSSSGGGDSAGGDDSGGDDEGGESGSTASSGAATGNPNVLIDVSGVGAMAPQIDTPVTSSGNTSLWSGEDGLGVPGGDQ